MNGTDEVTEENFTELRKELTAAINERYLSRDGLEEIYGKGKVYDTKELSESFEVQGFAAPFVLVRRKSDRKEGVLSFQHNPRFYFEFVEG